MMIATVRVDRARVFSSKLDSERGVVGVFVPDIVFKKASYFTGRWIGERMGI